MKLQAKNFIHIPFLASKRWLSFSNTKCLVFVVMYEITFIGKIGEGKPNTSFCCISISGVSTLPLMVSTKSGYG